MSSANISTLPEKDVIDVGCGEGGMVRVMTAAGARVIGVDCSPRQLEKARGAEAAGGENLCRWRR